MHVTNTVRWPNRWPWCIYFFTVHSLGRARFWQPSHRDRNNNNHNNNFQGCWCAADGSIFLLLSTFFIIFFSFYLRGHKVNAQCSSLNSHTGLRYLHRTHQKIYLNKNPSCSAKIISNFFSIQCFWPSRFFLIFFMSLRATNLGVIFIYIFFSCRLRWKIIFYFVQDLAVLSYCMMAMSFITSNTHTIKCSVTEFTTY